MNQNPYKAPVADVSITTKIEVPKEIENKIKNGWIAAIISGLLTLGIMLFALKTGTLSNIIDIWTSLDVVIIFALAFGIYKKSRFAATMMFIYFLASKIIFIVEAGKPTGLFFSIIFLYFYFQAMVATFQYHKILKMPNEQL